MVLKNDLSVNKINATGNTMYTSTTINTEQELFLRHNVFAAHEIPLMAPFYIYCAL